MDFEEIMGLIALLALVVLPALALTIRIALKPIVESIVRLRDAFLGTPRVPGDPARVARLEKEVKELRAEVARLGSLEEFYGELAESTERESPGKEKRRADSEA